MTDPLDSPPADHGSDRHGYVELAYNPVTWSQVVDANNLPVPSDELIDSLRCKDCLPNLFMSWDGERWHSTVAHDDGCPAFAQLQ